MARADIHWCEVDARIVVIDIARDRYLQLPQPLAEAFHALRHGGPRRDEPAQRFEALVRLGLCDPDFGRPAEPSRIAVPACDAPSRALGDRRRQPLATGAVLARIAIARLAVRLVPLRVLARWIRRVQSRPATPATRDQVAARTAVFVQARQLLSARGTCLPDAIALLHFLRTRKIACRMVFGVRLDPFEAHCWVQDSGAILGDTQERVACFTPILEL